ncbi:hypothetical protein GCM10012279_02750 [Micromonospora yangpuensis]|uniref:Uncharacterized protein n=1 Tax=Micromonospora yangpuensis TaxID=683228 RepID=A0A1C6U9U6_9ACTN|nr:hypothetical protein GCM10012279_02750 [Micromonospora yangpuensis]SCL50629.1 hypothetical protein GA0070617_1542 [Micromonospora yangpuensis]
MTDPHTLREAVSAKGSQFCPSGAISPVDHDIPPRMTRRPSRALPILRLHSASQALRMWVVHKFPTIREFLRRKVVVSVV